MHASDCAVYNEPAMPRGKCDCGANAPKFHVAPIVIEFMLAHYTIGTPESLVSHLGEDRWRSPAGRETLLWLRAHNLIDAEGAATPRGKAWVAMLLAVPLPVQAWLPPDSV